MAAISTVKYGWAPCLPGYDEEAVNKAEVKEF